MINVSDIVADPDFAQPFVVTRDSGGTMVLGIWQAAVSTLNLYGVIEPATPEELNQIPEGDRVNGIVAFWCNRLIYETGVENNSNAGGISDTIAWNGNNYRIVKVTPWNNFGYVKAFGSRMAGA